MSTNGNKERWFFIGCILMAALFWVMQKLSSNYNFVQKYSVRYVIPNGKVFKKPPPDEVVVMMSGKGWDLISKSTKNIGNKIEVELSNENNQLIPASSIAEKINAILASNEIAVSQIKPSIINIILEDQSSKKVPVISKLNIDFLPGFYMRKKFDFSPDSVVVTGSPKILDEISNWSTEILNINKLNKNLVDMPVALNKPESEMIRLSHDKVKLNLEVEEYTEKEFLVPVSIKNFESNAKVLPDKVKVKCTVGISKYDLLTENEIEMYINLDGSLLVDSVNTAPISISRLPEYIRHIEFQPKSARYFIVK